MGEQSISMSSSSSVNSMNKSKGGVVGYYRHLIDTIWRPLLTISGTPSSVVIFFFLTLLVAAFLATRYLDPSPIFKNSAVHTILAGELIHNKTHPDNKTTQSTNVVYRSEGETLLAGKSIHNATQQDNKATRTTAANQVNNSEPQTSLGSQSIGSDSNPESRITHTTKQVPQKIEFPLGCSPSRICPTNYPKNLTVESDAPPPSTCPEYFRWIYEDLRPWSKTGITKEMVERARRTATFRLVILNGKAYVERYKKSYQTRDDFTLWGILQLLRKYPGKVPDLDLMFDCVDWPVIVSQHFRGPKAPAPPPLFRYCGDDSTLDIVFPDWSFWGWSEVNIKPWEIISKELKEGNERMKWAEREPYAYWKGNPFVAPTRMDLLKCNISDKEDWHARVYIQDWFKEGREGYKQSDLAAQCIYRYKIYIEGSAWSVSEKYILACDSLTLLVKPRYYDFFTRGLMPMQHYFPVKDNDKCRSIKHAVEWGESHKSKTQAIGKAASDFIQEDIKMDYVYDYMLHLLNEYAKLLRFKPTIPENAMELCSEWLACPAAGREKQFMMDSMVMSPSDRVPCMMPPPFDPVALQTINNRKASTISQVETWEKHYWDNQTMHNVPSL